LLIIQVKIFITDIMATLQDFRNERLRKLADLQTLGVNPYPSKSSRTHRNKQIVDDYDMLNGTVVSVVGRITAIRRFGKLNFIKVRDESGDIQLVWKAIDETSAPNYTNSELSLKEISLLDTGDFVEATGMVFKTKTEEISVEITTLRLLTKSLRPLPLAHEEFSNVESRYRQRYIDLNVNEEVKKDLMLRGRVIEIIRQFLIKQNFLEVETPVLQPIYGGASARPFTTYHNSLESEFYLRISPELYLKRAIVGGFERVFEFARNFRNEGIDRSHNPEFTMLEFYWAYADYNDLMDLTSAMIREVLTAIFGKTSFEYQGQELDFSNIRKITFKDLIFEKTGVDISKITKEELLQEIKSRKIDVNPNAPLKDLLDEFYKETCRKQVIQPIYLLDYPAEMIPLAKKKADKPEYIESVQLVCCGFELLKAYSELNDPIDQLARLTEDQKGIEEGTSEESMTVDIDFVTALEYGMPPTAGWGMGIDRFVSFLANRPAIKDVIMFPTLRPEEVDEATRSIYPDVKFDTLKKKKK
jgi:lysyl-tRNA synthetase class 2